jgi:hypothetical protein
MQMHRMQDQEHVYGGSMHMELCTNMEYSSSSAMMSAMPPAASATPTKTRKGGDAVPTPTEKATAFYFLVGPV